MDTPDNTFFSAISRFKSQDFAESSNQEIIMIKSLIDELEPQDVASALSAIEANNRAHLQQQQQQQQSYAMQDQLGNLAPSPVALYPYVSMYQPSNQPGQGYTSAFASGTGKDSRAPSQQPSSYGLPSSFQPRPQSSVPANFLAKSNSGGSLSQRQAMTMNELTQQLSMRYQTASKPSAPSASTVSPPTPAKKVRLSVPHVSFNNNPQVYSVESSGPQPSVDNNEDHRVRKGKQSNEASPSSPEEDTTTLPDSDNEAINGQAADGTNFSASIHGETRLNIKFFNKGVVGSIPQKFGKANCLIPDGLAGTLQMYEQRWRFEIKHEYQNETVLIRWTIQNLISQRVTSILETLQDALNREGCGRTICNNVLKKAMEDRACELEESLKEIEVSSPSRANNLRNMIKHLRPKRCTVGLLFFGLLHREIQTLMAKQMAQRMAQKQ